MRRSARQRKKLLKKAGLWLDAKQRENFLKALHQRPALEPHAVHIPLDRFHREFDRIWLRDNMLGDCCVIAGPPILEHEEQEIYDILVSRMKARANTVDQGKLALLEMEKLPASFGKSSQTGYLATPPDPTFGQPATGASITEANQLPGKIRIIDAKTWDLGPGTIVFQRLDIDDTSELSRLEGTCKDLKITFHEEEEQMDPGAGAEEFKWREMTEEEERQLAELHERQRQESLSKLRNRLEKERRKQNR